MATSEDPDATFRLSHLAQGISNVNVLPENTSALGETIISLANEYCHEPISRDSIRLLQIAPGSLQDDISCRLQIAGRRSAPKYDALSYCWGAGPTCHRILIEGKAHYIRSNLFEALRRIRSATTPMLVWADAVCINQNDNNEKSVQVQEMDTVYYRADKVLIWLGDSGDDSDYAMEYVSRIVDQRNETPKVFDHNDFRGYVALARLINREWFRRVWIIQEVAFAKNPVILCGKSEVHFQDMMEAVNSVKENVNGILNHGHSFIDQSCQELFRSFEGSSAAQLMAILPVIFTKSEDGTILEKRMRLEWLVSNLFEFQATDLRDMIFAVMSLSPDARAGPAVELDVTSPVGPLPPEDGQDVLKIDYSTDVVSLWGDFVEHCMLRSSSLDIICRPWATMDRLEELEGQKWMRQGAVPSWIDMRKSESLFSLSPPKQTRRFSFIGAAPNPSLNENPTYQASFGITPEFKIFRNPRFRLQTKGIRLGDLSGMRDQATSITDSVITLDFLWNIITFLDESVPRGFKIGWKRESIDLDNRDLQDRIWRLLCGNRDIQGKPFTSASEKEAHRTVLLALLGGFGFRDESLVPYDRHQGINLATTEWLREDSPKAVYDAVRNIGTKVYDRKSFFCKSRLKGWNAFCGLCDNRARGRRDIGDNSDQVFILFGLSVPVILRKFIDDPKSSVTGGVSFRKGYPHFSYVSEAYIDGVMDGEIIQGLGKTLHKYVEEVNLY